MSPGVRRCEPKPDVRFAKDAPFSGRFVHPVNNISIGGAFVKGQGEKY